MRTMMMLAWAVYALTIHASGFGWVISIAGGLVALAGVLAIGRWITK